jgi:hypothetical protein
MPTRKTVSKGPPVEVHRLPAVQKSVSSPSGYLSESWTDRPDALEILAKCAAHIRAAEVPSGECSDARSPEWLARQAAEILNACEFQLKKESLLAADRIEKQKRDLVRFARGRGPLTFAEGIKELTSLGDARPARVENSVKTLIGKDFDSNPRHPRELVETRRLWLGDSPSIPSRSFFIEKEMEWYRAKGFTEEDMMNLELLRGKRDRP